ncbi:MAG: hypothetical protein IKR18_02035 [Bacteroidaceae bacterium]|nr:hypothetical protein [Bacteroidaceae bacterium]
MDDKILVVVNEGKKYRCFYYGTSDDFMDAREGFLPGFIALEASELKLDGDAISFHLNSTDCNFYSQPVETDLRNERDIIRAGYKLWLQTPFSCWENVLMEGTFSGDSIVLVNKTFYSWLTPDVYYRESPERVKALYNRNLISPEDERRNNVEFNWVNDSSVLPNHDSAM